MGKEHYPYLTPALVTVAACTFGAYLIWRQGVNSSVHPTNTSEMVVMTRNRRAEAVAEDRAAVVQVRKSVQDSNYLQISGETSLNEFYDSEKTHISVDHGLHSLSQVSNENKDEDQKSKPNGDNEELKSNSEDTGFSSDTEETSSEESIRKREATASDLHLSSGYNIEEPGFESNVTINNTTLEQTTSEKCISRTEVILPTLTEKSGFINEASGAESDETINDSMVTLVDLRQISSPENEVPVRDSTLSSGSKMEVPGFESNAATNNYTLEQIRSEEYISKQEVTSPDLSPDFGSLIKVPDSESNRTVNNNTALPPILTKNSGSINEVPDCGSNKAMNNSNVTLKDLSQTSGPKNEEPDHESNAAMNNNDVTLQDTCQTSEPKNDVSDTRDIQKVLGFLGLTSHTKEENLMKTALTRKQWKRNPMYLAMREGNLSVVQSLLRLGASLDFTDRQGQFPTHLAASSGNIELLEILVHWGGDLSRKDMFGYTPFHRAALSGQTETIIWLYERGGGFIMETTWAGWTPLHLAVMNGHYTTSVQLLKFGADVNAKDKDGWTPLYLAKLYKRTEVMILLKSWEGTF